MGTKGTGSLRSPENDLLLEILRSVRTEKGVSQEALSSKMGQSTTFIVKIERGTRRIDVVEFIRLANELDVDPVELFGEVVSAINRRSKR